MKCDDDALEMSKWKGWRNQMKNHLQLIVNTRQEGNDNKEISHFPISPSPSLCVFFHPFSSFVQTKLTQDTTSDIRKSPFHHNHLRFLCSWLRERERFPFVFLLTLSVLPLIRHRPFFCQVLYIWKWNENSERHTHKMTRHYMSGKVFFLQHNTQPASVHLITFAE